MSVDGWARREAEKRWPVKRDKFGILSREEAAMNAIQRAGFEEGLGLALSALLSDEAVEAAARGHVEYRAGRTYDEAEHLATRSEVEVKAVRVALQAAIEAVTKGDTE